MSIDKIDELKKIKCSKKTKTKKHTKLLFKSIWYFNH